MDNNLPMQTAFTLFDMLAIGTIVISVSVSAMRGVVAELIAFGGWLLALIVARAACISVAQQAFPHLEPFEMAIVLSFVLVFVGMRLLLHLINYGLNYLIKIGDLTYLNRTLGALVGLLKGFLFVGLAVLVCSFTSIPQKQSWQIAKTSSFFERIAKLFIPTLPDFLGVQVQFPARFGELDYDASSESTDSTFSGSLKKPKSIKNNQLKQSSQPSLKNLPQGTSTE